MMICCIFLAGKAEENFISIEELLKFMPKKFSSADVIRKEAELLEVLGFDLRVYHPQNIIHSLLGDWKVYHIKNSSLNADQKLHLSSLVKLWARYSEYLLHEILTTQACLQFTPFELSLHVLAYTAADSMFEECQSSFGQYVFERCGKSQSQRLHTSYDHLVTFCRQLVTQGCFRPGPRSFSL
jgi:aminoglycoside/choline kinase family phosphotransferase